MDQPQAETLTAVERTGDTLCAEMEMSPGHINRRSQTQDATHSVRPEAQTGRAGRNTQSLVLTRPRCGVTQRPLLVTSVRSRVSSW